MGGMGGGAPSEHKFETIPAIKKNIKCKKVTCDSSGWGLQDLAGTL